MTLVANHREDCAVRRTVERRESCAVVSRRFGQTPAAHDGFVVIARPEVVQAETVAYFVQHEAALFVGAERVPSRFVHCDQTVPSVGTGLRKLAVVVLVELDGDSRGRKDAPDGKTHRDDRIHAPMVDGCLTDHDNEYTYQRSECGISVKRVTPPTQIEDRPLLSAPGAGGVMSHPTRPPQSKGRPDMAGKARPAAKAFAKASPKASFNRNTLGAGATPGGAPMASKSGLGRPGTPKGMTPERGTRRK